MQNNRFKVTNAVGLVVVLTVNYLANAWPINGQKTNVISDKYFNQFAPAGVTFAIWGLIYSLLLGLVVWQFFGKNAAKNAAIGSMGWLLGLNFALNAVWIFLWHYELLGLSVVVMLAILGTLIRLNRVEKMQFSPEMPAAWLPRAAFGIYLGWICVATIANVTTLLVSLNWGRFGLSETFWTGSMIGVGAITAAMLVVRYKNVFIGLAVIWALVGIAIRQHQLHQHFTAISWAALTWGLAVVASLFYGIRKPR